MISFDQVLLLEEKVESAVKKIEQLNAENAALRAKVAELSNALEAKSEQFSSFQSDQSKIEEGILKALSRLNAVENVVLSASTARAETSESPAAQSSSVQNEIPQTAGENPVQAASVSETQSVSVGIPSNQEGSSSEQFFVENTQQETSVQLGAKPQAESFGQEDSSRQVVEPSVPQETDSLTPDVDFEFGESDNTAVLENPDGDSPQQPMFDIF